MVAATSQGLASFGAITKRKTETKLQVPRLDYKIRERKKGNSLPCTLKQSKAWEIFDMNQWPKVPLNRLARGKKLINYTIV